MKSKQNLTIGFECSKPSFPSNFRLAFPGGYVIDYHTLLPFYSDDTGKHYVIYSDGTVDDDGDTRVYASIYNPESLVVCEEASIGIIELHEIQTPEEWAIIEEIVDEMNVVPEG